MPTTEKTLRVLVVDDNRDGADALGLLLEELGNQVHVTYGGTQALDVATAFRPDLMLVDLVMPDMDGCGLVMRIRQIPAFAHTKIVAITGQKDEEHKALAMKAGFDTVLFKPVALTEIKAVLASVVQVVAPGGQSPKVAKSVRVSAQSDVCRLTKLGESGTSGNQEPLLKRKAKQPSVRGSFAFKRSIWDGGRSRFTPTSSKTSWWSAFSVF